jgi:hypothetical protein
MLGTDKHAYNIHAKTKPFTKSKYIHCIFLVQANRIRVNGVLPSMTETVTVFETLRTDFVLIQLVGSDDGIAIFSSSLAAKSTAI